MRSRVKNSLVALAVVFGSAGAAPKEADADEIKISGKGDFGTASGIAHENWVGKNFTFEMVVDLDTPAAHTGNYDAVTSLKISVEDTLNNPEFYLNSTAQRLAITNTQALHNVPEASVTTISGIAPSDLRGFQILFNNAAFDRTLAGFAITIQQPSVQKQFAILFDDNTNAVGHLDQFQAQIINTSSVPDISAFNAALLAAGGVGLRKRRDIIASAKSLLGKIMPVLSGPR